MKRILLICLTTIITAASAFAIPAKPGVHTRTQSDGSVVRFERFGDEFSHYTLVEGFYTVVEDSVGDFCYATIKDNRLASSGVKVRPINALSSKEREIAVQSIGLRPMGQNPLFNREMHSPEATIAKRIKEQAAARVEANEKALTIDQWGGEVYGERDLLVILVEYTDKKFTISSPREKFKNMLNQEGYSENGNIGSVNDYFVDASNGKFHPKFDVVGPYCLPQKRAYYGGNEDPLDFRSDDLRPAHQTVDACNLASADGVDFSKYDNDGDGVLDLVFIVYAGHNPAEGGPDEAIWPHQWDIHPGKNITQKDYPTYNNTRLVSYACTSELQGAAGAQMCNIGTFCHEFGHALGLPDWYDTTGGASFGMSWASIMNSGSYLNNSRTPPTYNIVERWLLGWAFPKEITETGYYEMEHISSDEAYIMWANDTYTECFLFEARTAAANYKWDKYLIEGDKQEDIQHQGGEGMLVYHLVWDSGVIEHWKYHTINGDTSHECAQIFRSVPTAGNNASKGWFFPGSRKVKTLSYDGIPQFQNWDREKLPFFLDNITIDGTKVSFYAMVNELVIDVRQYDALINWQDAEANFSQWDVVCTNKENDEVVFQRTIGNKYVNITPLNTNSNYFVVISGKGESEPTFEFEITTQSNTLSPMSSLNVSSVQKSNDFVRLSVKNLDCNVDDIVWYIDGKKSQDTYLKLSTGTHQICAVITDTEGNTEYLYRDITVQ